MVEIEFVDRGRPTYLASRVAIPLDGRRLRFERQGEFFVLKESSWSTPAGSIGVVAGVAQVVAEYHEQILLAGEDPNGVSSAYLIDGDELTVARTRLRVHADRAPECPACHVPLRARPLNGFGFPIDRCAGCLTLSRNLPDQPGQIFVEGAFVRRVIERVERAAREDTLDATLLEIRSDPELRPVLQLPEIVRLTRRRG